MSSMWRYGGFIRQASKLHIKSARQFQCQLWTSQSHMQKSYLDPDEEKPIKYSTSGAKSWDSVSGFQPPKFVREAPWYQPIVVFGSVAIFLIYFTMLREENDLDEQLVESLYDTMPGLEEKNIHVAIQYEKSQGRNTDALEKRLKELDAMKT